MKPLNYRVYPDYGPLKNFSLVTSYKSAIELYEKFRVSAYNPNTVAICVEMSDGFRKLLVTKEDVTKFEKEYICMQPKNRVEARIMRDLEEKRFRDEIPELMGKTFPEKEVDFHGEFGELTEAQRDQIINPKHYKILPVGAMKHFLDKGMEYMDIMRYALKQHTGAKAHVLGQVFKYAFRIGGKDDELQDAKKMAWYANRMVEEIKFERGETQNIPRGEYKEKKMITNEDIEAMKDQAQAWEDIQEDLRDVIFNLQRASISINCTADYESEFLDSFTQELDNLLYKLIGFIDNENSRLDNDQAYGKTVQGVAP